MCGCAQRRAALAQIVSAAASGNAASAVSDAARVVVRTSVQDIAALAKRAASHARLKR